MFQHQTEQKKIRQEKPSENSHYFENVFEDKIFEKVEEYLSIDILRNFPMAFFWMDKNGYLLGANEVELQFLGLNSLAQFIGRHICDFATIDVWKNCQRVMNEKVTEILEEKVIDNNSSQRTFLTIKSPLQGKRKEVIGLVGVSIDITPNKKAQEVVMQMKDSILKTIGHYVPINFYWMDRNGFFLGGNEEEIKALGVISVDQIIGKHSNEFAHPSAWENSKKVMQDDKIQILEECHINEKSEQIVYLSIKSPVHDTEGNVVGLVGVSIDITERKKAEEVLRKAKEETEVTNARIKAMAGSIAHELRTPLGCIGMNLGGIDTMITDPSEENCEAAKESLGEIRKELESANTIINMLLMNIREQLDWQKEKMEVCSINECVEEALRRYPFVEDQRSKVSWKKSKDFQFKGNAIFMQHVIFNLLKNALAQINKAGKGEITIWTEKESGTAKETSTEKESEGFSLHFKDTASGVPKDILPHLFERFFSRTKNGTGLGLAFCKMVIESFGGTISCQSVEGEYTEFKICFLNN